MFENGIDDFMVYFFHLFVIASNCFLPGHLFYMYLNFQESLFYTVPPTAMEMYRKSIESHFLQYEVDLFS